MVHLLLGSAGFWVSGFLSRLPFQIGFAGHRYLRSPASRVTGYPGPCWFGSPPVLLVLRAHRRLPRFSVSWVPGFLGHGFSWSLLFVGYLGHCFPVSPVSWVISFSDHRFLGPSVSWITGFVGQRFTALIVFLIIGFQGDSILGSLVAWVTNFLGHLRPWSPASWVISCCGSMGSWVTRFLTHHFLVSSVSWFTGFARVLGGSPTSWILCLLGHRFLG